MTKSDAVLDSVGVGGGAGIVGPTSNGSGGRTAEVSRTSSTALTEVEGTVAGATVNSAADTASTTASSGVGRG